MEWYLRASILQIFTWGEQQHTRKNNQDLEVSMKGLKYSSSWLPLKVFCHLFAKAFLARYYYVKTISINFQKEHIMPIQPKNPSGAKVYPGEIFQRVRSLFSSTGTSDADDYAQVFRTILNADLDSSERRAKASESLINYFAILSTSNDQPVDFEFLKSLTNIAGVILLLWM